MKAMVYYGEGDIRFEEHDKPRIIDPTDAVVRITKTTICGTDLAFGRAKIPKFPPVGFWGTKASALWKKSARR